jgi:drug/metabolite transporter (DMT)-like permease
MRWRAELYALGAVACWATVATAFKLALVHIAPVGLLFLASATSLLIYFVVLLVNRSLGELIGLPRRTLLGLLGLGCLNPGLYYLILFNAYDRLPAQIAQSLNQIWPFVLALMSIPLLGHKMGRGDVLGLALGFAGVFVVSSGGQLTRFDVFDPLGVALALGSSLVWAAYWLLNVRFVASESVKLFCNFFTGTVLTGALAFAAGALDSLSWRALAGGLYVGCFEMGFAFIFWMKALQMATQAARVANLVYITPVLSLFFIASVLGEKILPATVGGLVLILGGLVVQKRVR